MSFQTGTYDKSVRGFTLIEIVLSVALITVLLSILLPVFRDLQSKNELSLSLSSVAQSLRRAQNLAEASQGDSAWGAYISTSSATVFKGLSYSGRDSSFDESTKLLGIATTSGLTEIIFNKLTGSPISAGTTTLISSSNETASININSQGTVSY